MKKAECLYIAAVLCLMAALPQARAAAPQLDIQMKTGMQSGLIHDGTRIARGRISQSDLHTGFQVWSNAPRAGSQAQSYLLSGIDQSRKPLRVRLEGNGWSPDTENGQGIVLHTPEPFATFDVVVDGDQIVQADAWQVQLNGNALQQ